MRTPKVNFASKAIVVTAAIVGLNTIAMAGAVTWDGVGTSGSPVNWSSSPSHWSNGSTPNLVGGTDTATISSGYVGYTGPDLEDNSTLTIDGTGTWAQTTNNWIKIGSGAGQTGNLVVNTGGTFNTGTAVDHLWVGYNNAVGNIDVNGGTLISNGTYLNNASSTIKVENGGSFTTNLFNNGAGGSLNVTGGSFTSNTSGIDIGTGNTFSMSGGTVTFSGGEFKPKKDGLVTISGGTLNVNLISFDGDTTATIAFSGGRINDVAATWDGIYSGGGYLNYLANSAGVLFLQGDTAGAHALALLNSGKVRDNGVTDASKFTITTDGTGSTIQLTAIPEPASLAVIGLTGLVGLRRRRR